MGLKKKKERKEKQVKSDPQILDGFAGLGKNSADINANVSKCKNRDLCCFNYRRLQLIILNGANKM